MPQGTQESLEDSYIRIDNTGDGKHNHLDAKDGE